MSARTPKPMTPKQLAEITARADAATPGPWLLDPDGPFGSGTVVAEAGGTGRLVGELGFGDGEEASADRSFTLHARTDVPTLLAEITRLRTQCRFLLEQVRRKDAASGQGDRALAEFLAEPQHRSDPCAPGGSCRCPAGDADCARSSVAEAERDFARCSQYWAAARCARNFRTAQADRKFSARIRRLFRGGAR